MRAYETHGAPRHARRIELLGRDDRGRLRRARDQDVPRAARPAQPVIETDLLEWRELALDGEGWQLRGCLGDEWRWHVGPTSRGTRRAGCPRACRAASSTTSCARARCDDPYFERKSRLAEWVPARTWVYRRAVVEGERRHDRVRRRRPRGDRASSTARRSRTTRARSRRSESRSPAGEHLLAVVVHAAPRERAAGRPDEPGARPQEPDGVRLGLLPAADPPGDLAAGHARIDGRRARSPRVRRSKDGRSATVEPRRRARPCSRGRGAASSGGRTGSASSASTMRGRLHVPSASARSSSTATTRLVVNGVRTCRSRAGTGCRSTRSTACRARRSSRTCCGSPPSANANLLRVWGGGLIETPEFYELCDRLGLLVWQEFSQSSSGIENVPADDPGLRVGADASDARQIVPRLRRHPSLAIWGGGNELDGDGSDAGARRAPRRRARSSIPAAPGCRPRRSADDRPARPVGAPGPREPPRALRLAPRRRCTASSASRG